MYPLLRSVCAFECAYMHVCKYVHVCTCVWWGGTTGRSSEEIKRKLCFINSPALIMAKSQLTHCTVSIAVDPYFQVTCFQIG